MARRKQKADEPVNIRAVPLEYYDMENVPAVYADGVIVQSDENGFTVIFFQAEKPITLSEQERASIKKVRTKCVGKVFIPPAVFKTAIEAFQRNFERRNSRFPAIAQPETDEEEL